MVILILIFLSCEPATTTLRTHSYMVIISFVYYLLMRRRMRTRGGKFPTQKYENLMHELIVISMTWLTLINVIYKFSTTSSSACFSVVVSYKDKSFSSNVLMPIIFFFSPQNLIPIPYS